MRDEDSIKVLGYLTKRRSMIDGRIEAFLPRLNGDTQILQQCMHYAVEGGKRLRPILTIAVAELLGATIEKVIPTACAIEFIHSYSLVLDDLPCMDNDDYRRGRPTCHKVFGEHVALLAADALLNLAISILGRNYDRAGVDPVIALQVIQEVGEAVGLQGAIGAQLEDLLISETASNKQTLESILAGKTASLFRLSARAGALIAGATPFEIKAITGYATNLGFAFQIADDILDQEQDSNSVAGGTKPRLNYARTFGLEEAKALLANATQSAQSNLAMFDDKSASLALLAEFNLKRVL